MGAPNTTPGPWEFRVYADGCTIVSKHDMPGRSVRDLLKGVSVTVDAQIWDNQSNANEASPDARLIASAPCLLSIARRWAAIDGGAWNVERYERERAELLAETRAVIARARGEA